MAKRPRKSLVTLIGIEVPINDVMKVRMECLRLAIGAIQRPKNYDEETMMDYYLAVLDTGNVFFDFMMGTSLSDLEEEEEN